MLRLLHEPSALRLLPSVRLPPLQLLILLPLTSMPAILILMHIPAPTPASVEVLIARMLLPHRRLRDRVRAAAGDRATLSRQRLDRRH